MGPAEIVRYVNLLTTNATEWGLQECYCLYNNLTEYGRILGTGDPNNLALFSNPPKNSAVARSCCN